MKKSIILVLVLVAAGANAQSLKETLYSGKLKSDTGTVVRKTDDLSTKIDTTTRRKPVEPEKPKLVPITRDSITATGETVTVIDSTAASPAATLAENVSTHNTVANRDNNKIWKDFIDSFVTSLRMEVMPSKKIKSGSYSVLLEYQIDLDGSTTITNVSVSPESDYLAEQVRNRFTLLSPQMNPVLNNYGKPRKAGKKHMFTIAK